jgi:hypothetical protein
MLRGEIEGTRNRVRRLSEAGKTHDFYRFRFSEYEH